MGETAAWKCCYLLNLRLKGEEISVTVVFFLSQIHLLLLQIFIWRTMQPALGDSSFLLQWHLWPVPVSTEAVCC